MDLKWKKTQISLQCSFPFPQSPFYLFTERASIWQIPLGSLPFPRDECNAVSLTFVYKKPNKYQWRKPSTQSSEQPWRLPLPALPAAWLQCQYVQGEEGAAGARKQVFLPFVFHISSQAARVRCRGASSWYYHLRADGIFLCCPKWWPRATCHYWAPALCLRWIAMSWKCKIRTAFHRLNRKEKPC